MAQRIARQAERERTTTKTTLPTGKAAQPATSPLRGLLSRLAPPRVDRASSATPAGAQAAARPKTPWRRLLFGMLIFIVAMQVFQYALFFLQAKFGLGLNLPVGKSIPLIGSMSRFTLLYLVFMLVLYFGLLRFNVIPNGKSLRAQRTMAAQPTASSAATSRTARRRAARHAATTTASTVSTARRTATNTPARTKSGQTVEAAGVSDDVYERVKSAQRTRRRREAKR